MVIGSAVVIEVALHGGGERAENDAIPFTVCLMAASRDAMPSWCGGPSRQSGRLDDRRRRLMKRVRSRAVVREGVAAVTRLQ
jgi:hypothetical protein